LEGKDSPGHPATRRRNCSLKEVRRELEGDTQKGEGSHTTTTRKQEKPEPNLRDQKMGIVNEGKVV